MQPAREPLPRCRQAAMVTRLPHDIGPDGDPNEGKVIFLDGHENKKQYEDRKDNRERRDDAEQKLDNE